MKKMKRNYQKNCQNLSENYQEKLSKVYQELNQASQTHHLRLVYISILAM